MKIRKLFVLVLVFIILLIPASVLAHSGRTDGNGGHTDKSTGVYHYHHGYSAHQHPGGVCPYEDDSEDLFEDDDYNPFATDDTEYDIDYYRERCSDLEYEVEAHKEALSIVCDERDKALQQVDSLQSKLDYANDVIALRDEEIDNIRNRDIKVIAICGAIILLIGAIAKNIIDANRE